MYTKFIYVYKKFVCVRIHTYILIKKPKKTKKIQKKKIRNQKIWTKKTKKKRNCMKKQ